MDIKINAMVMCGLVSFGSEQGSVVGSSKHGK